MKAVLQRTENAEVTVDGQSVGRIEFGLLVYVGVGVEDSQQDAKKIADKVAQLRIFEDDDGKMNLSVRDVGGSVLAVPNFTLQADARKGRRPAFVDAARPDSAKPLFDIFVQSVRDAGVNVETGQFGADMRIASTAVGPVNIVLDFQTDS